jgi:DNA-binding response OmpR family regulator
MTGDILLVEDHVASAEMIIEVLQERGYRVRWAQTGQAAAELLAQARPALILLNLTLPDADPVELMRKLYPQRKNAPPLIIISALPATLVQAAMHRLGAVDVVRKPFSIHTLLDSVTAALSRRMDAA